MELAFGQVKCVWRLKQGNPCFWEQLQKDEMHTNSCSWVCHVVRHGLLVRVVSCDLLMSFELTARYKGIMGETLPSFYFCTFGSSWGAVLLHVSLHYWVVHLGYFVLEWVRAIVSEPAPVSATSASASSRVRHHQSPDGQLLGAPVAPSAPCWWARQHEN